MYQIPKGIYHCPQITKNFFMVWDAGPVPGLPRLLILILIPSAFDMPSAPDVTLLMAKFSSGLKVEAQES